MRDVSLPRLVSALWGALGRLPALLREGEREKASDVGQFAVSLQRHFACHTRKLFKPVQRSQREEVPDQQITSHMSKRRQLEHVCGDIVGLEPQTSLNARQLTKAVGHSQGFAACDIQASVDVCQRSQSLNTRQCSIEEQVKPAIDASKRPEPVEVTQQQVITDEKNALEPSELAKAAQRHHHIVVVQSHTATDMVE